MENIWRLFDKDRSGYLDESEAKAFITSLCQNNSLKGYEAQIKKILDKDGDGKLSKKEVLELLNSN